MEANFISEEGSILKKIMRKRIENFPVERFPTPSKTIKNVPWPQPSRIISMKQAIEWDINLNSFSILGRTATAVAITEKLFPDCQIKTAEVMEDKVAKFMLEIPFKDRDDAYLEKILAQESVHLILTLDGDQYDLRINSRCEHPKIKEFEPWEGIAIWRMISKLPEHNDPMQKIRLLLDIKETHPSSLVSYHLISLYLEVNQMQKSIQIARELLAERPQAALYYVLYLLTGEKKYKDALSDVYGPDMFNFISKQKSR